MKYLTGLRVTERYRQGDCLTEDFDRLFSIFTPSSLKFFILTVMYRQKPRMKCLAKAPCLLRMS